MNDTTPPPQNAITIGAFIKKLREQKKMSLRHVSQQTKINTTQLEFLEDDKLSQLPNRAYVAGYIKSIAKVLGANQEETLDILAASYQKLLPVQQVSPILSIKDGKKIPTTHAISAVIAIVAIFLVISVVVYKYSNSSKEVTQVTKAIETPVVTPVAPTVLPSPESILTPLVPELKYTPKIAEVKITPKATPIKIEEKKKVTPTPTTVPTKKEEKIAKPEEKKQEKQEKKREFYPIRSPMYTALDNIPEEMSKYLPGDIKAKSVPGKQNIYVVAVGGSTWVTYKSDKAGIRQVFLKQNDGVLIKGDDVRMFLGNLNSAIVFYNNKLLDIQSEKGIKSLVFPENNKSKYMVPLFVFDKEKKSVITSEDYMKAEKEKEKAALTATSTP